jgi:uncharacterized protein (DUF4415 family)
MKQDKNIKSFTAVRGPKAKRAKSRTDLTKMDARRDEKLERRIAEDEDELDVQLDWARAKPVLSAPKQSVHLRLEQDITDFFKAHGKGHIVRMQTVLKAYVDAHKPHAK